MIKELTHDSLRVSPVDLQVARAETEHISTPFVSVCTLDGSSGSATSQMAIRNYSRNMSDGFDLLIKKRTVSLEIRRRRARLGSTAGL
jgi:hypothetical protein